MKRLSALLFFSCFMFVGQAFSRPETHEFIVDQTSVDKYSDYIVAEAEPFVRSGEWVLDVFSDGVDTFEVPSRKEPYTKAEVLKILVGKTPHPYFQLKFKGKTFEGYAPRYSFTGRIARILPESVSPKFSEQSFRELVSINYSQSISPLRRLTFRFKGDDSDVLFKNSPVVKGVRRVSGANRTDRIFGSVLTLNDFFTLSEKQNELVIKSIEEQVLLSPVLSKTTLTTVSNCALSSLANEDSVLKSSGQHDNGKTANAYLLGASWLPKGVTYKPKEFLRIEAIISDPYAEYHQFIAYISIETGRVVYKILLSSSGEPDRFVFTVFDNNTGYPEYTVAKEYKSDGATLLHFNAAEYCDAELKKELLDSFVPKGISGEQ